MLGLLCCADYKVCKREIRDFESTKKVGAPFGHRPSNSSLESPAKNAVKAIVLLLIVKITTYIVYNI